MSDVRYTGTNRALHVGVFFLPLAPFLMAADWRHSPSHVINAGELALAWAIALGVHLALIVVHEGGHVLVARLANLRIGEISVGLWRRLFRFNVAGITVVIRAIPDSGHVTLQPTPEIGDRRRTIPMLAAGVAAELAVAGVACSVLASASPHYATFAEFSWLLVLWSVVLFAGYHALINLWPATIDMGGGHFVATDGQQILHALRAGSKAESTRALLEECHAVDAAIASGDIPLALAQLDGLTRRHGPKAEWDIVRATMLAESGDIDGAVVTLRSAVDRPETIAVERAKVFDALACLPLQHTAPQLLAEAESWIKQAMLLAPSAITLEGTLGAILLETGRMEEAERVLRRVRRISEDDTDQAIVAACLAKIAATNNQPELTDKFLSEAKTRPVSSAIVDRIVRELESSRTVRRQA